MDAEAVDQIITRDLTRRYVPERDAHDVSGTYWALYLADHVTRFEKDEGRDGPHWVVAGLARLAMTHFSSAKKPWWIRESRWNPLYHTSERIVFEYRVRDPSGEIFYANFGMTAERRGR